MAFVADLEDDAASTAQMAAADQEVRHRGVQRRRGNRTYADSGTLSDSQGSGGMRFKGDARGSGPLPTEPGERSCRRLTAGGAPGADMMPRQIANVR